MIGTTRSIPEDASASEEALVEELELDSFTAFFEPLWEASAMPSRTKRSLMLLDTAFTGVTTVNRLIEHSVKSSDFRYGVIRGAPLPATVLEGLFCAQEILMANVSANIEWLRDTFGKGDAQ